MASFTKRGNRYYAVFHDATRLPKRKTIPLQSTHPAKAQLEFEELEMQEARGDFDPWDYQKPIAPQTPEEAMERFFAAHNHRPKTKEAYRTALKGLLRVLRSKHKRLPAGLLLSYLSEEVVRAYVEDPNVSAATRAHRYRHLRAFFRFTVKAGLLRKSPMENVRAPRQSRTSKAFLMPEQAKHLIETIEADAARRRASHPSQPDRALWLADVVRFALCTGMRRGEICALQWGAVDLGARAVSVLNTDTFTTKSGDERRVPLTSDALAVIERRAQARSEDAATRRLDPKEPVFPGVKGGVLSGHFVSRRFKEYLRQAELPEALHFHSLRHTCASWLAMRGVPLTVIKDVLGHSSIQVTQQYAHLSDGTIRDAMDSAFDLSRPRLRKLRPVREVRRKSAA